VPMDFTVNAIGAPFLLPYQPNSMVISNDGSTIYLGSSTALMVLSAVNSLSLTRTDVTSPDVVLALSPDGGTLVLTDPVRQTITLQSSSGSVLTTFGGVGAHAEWAPDSQTVYITTQTLVTPATATTLAVYAPSNQVLVYSAYTGWTPVTKSVPASDVAITVPSVGAYFAGNPTTALSYCANSTQTGAATESNVFFPATDNPTSNPAVTDRIAATNDGLHILGAHTATTATSTTTTLSDLGVTIPVGSCPSAAYGIGNFSGAAAFSHTLTTTMLSKISATAITGVIPTSDSSVAFVTYTCDATILNTCGTSAVLPAFLPAYAPGGSGQPTYINLSGAATAPIAGVGSADNTFFYVGTSGDNLVHIINRSTLTDSSTLAPNLTSPTGAIVPVNLLVQKPRKTT